MATWNDVAALVEMSGGTRSYDDLVELNWAPKQGPDAGRRQTVFVSYLNGPNLPDGEAIQLSSVIAVVTQSTEVAAGAPASAIAETDIVELLLHFQQRFGACGGLQLSRQNDYACLIVTSGALPLRLLDLNDSFLRYLGWFALFADQMEQAVADWYGKAAARDVF